MICASCRNSRTHVCAGPPCECSCLGAWDLRRTYAGGRYGIVKSGQYKVGVECPRCDKQFLEALTLFVHWLDAHSERRPF